MIDSFSGPYFYLSNFYMHSITYEGVKYPSTEHAFQAAKSLDQEVRMRVSRLRTAAEAKKTGRNVTLRPDWENVKVAVMREVLRLKFADEGLRTLLLQTDGNELIEGNTWGDTFWGTVNGHGKNWLGKLLMELRASFPAP